MSSLIFNVADECQFDWTELGSITMSSSENDSVSGNWYGASSNPANVTNCAVSAGFIASAGYTFTLIRSTYFNEPQPTDKSKFYAWKPCCGLGSFSVSSPLVGSATYSGSTTITIGGVLYRTDACIPTDYVATGGVQTPAVEFFAELIVGTDPDTKLPCYFLQMSGGDIETTGTGIKILPENLFGSHSISNSVGYYALPNTCGCGAYGDGYNNVWTGTNTVNQTLTCTINKS